MEEFPFKCEGIGKSGVNVCVYCVLIPGGGNQCKGHLDRKYSKFWQACHNCLMRISDSED